MRSNGHRAAHRGLNHRWCHAPRCRKGVGRMGFKTFLYYAFSGAAAVIVGLLIVNLIQPGDIAAETAAAMLGTAAETSVEQGLMAKVEEKL